MKFARSSHDPSQTPPTISPVTMSQTISAWPHADRQSRMGTGEQISQRPASQPGPFASPRERQRNGPSSGGTEAAVHQMRGAHWASGRAGPSLPGHDRSKQTVLKFPSASVLICPGGLREMSFDHR